MVAYLVSVSASVEVIASRVIANDFARPAPVPVPDRGVDHPGVRLSGDIRAAGPQAHASRLQRSHYRFDQ